MLRLRTFYDSVQSQSKIFYIFRNGLCVKLSYGIYCFSHLYGCGQLDFKETEPKSNWIEQSRTLNELKCESIERIGWIICMGCACACHDHCANVCIFNSLLKWHFDCKTKLGTNTHTRTKQTATKKTHRSNTMRDLFAIYFYWFVVSQTNARRNMATKTRVHLQSTHHSLPVISIDLAIFAYHHNH